VRVVTVLQSEHISFFVQQIRFSCFGKSNEIHSYDTGFYINCRIP